MGSALLGFAMFAVFLACVASMVRDGLWSNAVKFINVMSAALLATSLYENLARGLENGVNSSLTYVWDFVSIWLLFVIFLVLFRLATGFVSKTKVRFKKPVDWAGGGVFAFGSITLADSTNLRRRAEASMRIDVEATQPVSGGLCRQLIRFVMRLKKSPYLTHVF